MPVDLDIIEKAGGTPDKLKALFEKTREEREATNPKVNQLINLHRDRMQEGIKRNIEEARHWWAIDRAFDVTHRQITYTLVQGLIDKKPSEEQVLSAATDWGITSMLTPLLDKEGKPVFHGNVPAMKLDLPTFFNIFVPVVMSYTKIRWAKLFNDRDLTPLYKYAPLQLSSKSRLKAEIITDRISRMATEMGYRDDERQSILQALLYGVCLNFPMEDYWREKQLATVNGQEKERIVREGVRFAMPHPRNVFFDQSNRPSTFNFDNGADHAGYWQIVRYGDVRVNDKYWNTDKITWGGSAGWPFTREFGLFSSLFPCSLKFPQVGSQMQDNNREAKAFVYNTSNDDAAVNLVSLVHKIVPKDWGLYDYAYPVWHRFVYAAEDTCIHCVPLAYSPVVAYLYDYDNNRSRNPSLAQELLPWQDHFSNLMSQYLLSVKKNLTRVVFWNSDILDANEVREIRNLGEKMLQELRMIPFSNTKLGFGQQNVQNAFHPVAFQALNTAEIVQAINTTINIMERVLGFSSQELSAPATHEQSATEVNIVAQNTSVRMEFTGGFVDQAIWARKRLLYDAMMAYSDDEIFAEVADLNDQKKADLKDLGFEVEEEDASGRRAGVRGDKSTLTIEGFASEREGANRINDTKIASTMIQTFQSVFSNPAIIQSAGLEQVFDLFNQILVYAGLPKDFKLRFDPSKSPEQNAQAAQDQTKQLQQAMVKIAQQVVGNEMAQVGDTIRTKVVEPIAQKQQQTDQEIQALAAQTQQIEQTIKMMIEKLAPIIQAAQQPPPPPPMPPGVIMGPPGPMGPPPPMPPPGPIPPEAIPPGVIPMPPQAS